MRGPPDDVRRAAPMALYDRSESAGVRKTSGRREQRGNIMIGIVLLTPRISSTSCFFGDWIGVVWIWAGLCNCGVVGNAEPERHGAARPVKPAVPLVRAGMQDRLVVAVAIDEVDGVIGLWREA